MSLLATRWGPVSRQCFISSSLPHLRFQTPLKRPVNALGSSLKHLKTGQITSSIQVEEVQDISENTSAEVAPNSVMPWRAVALGLAIVLCGLGVLGPSPAMASAGEKLAASFQGKIPDWLVVLFISAFPIVELRGAIPVSVAMLGLDPLRVLGLAIVGNMIPVPFILLFLGPLSNALSRFSIFKTLFDKIFERSRNQGAAWKKNEFWALTMFVGLPLPGTGAWSGAIGAFVLGMPFAKAFLANLLGVCIAGGVVTSLTMLGWKGLAIAVAVFIGIPALAILRGKKEPRSAAE